MVTGIIWQTFYAAVSLFFHFFILDAGREKYDWNVGRNGAGITH